MFWLILCDIRNIVRQADFYFSGVQFSDVHFSFRFGSVLVSVCNKINENLSDLLPVGFKQITPTSQGIQLES